MASRDSAWLHTVGPSDSASACLVCLPHAGGAATAFLGVGRRLAPTIDVVAIQYPGRQERYREPYIADIRELADAVYAELEPLLDRRLALFGHSMGALIGYEVALPFERDSREHLLGFVPSGRWAPSMHRPDATPQTDEELKAELHRLSGTDGRLLLDEEMLQMVLRTLRADYQAIDRYRAEPDPRLHCPVVVCVGDSDPLTTLEEAHAWSHHTHGSFDVQTFPGGHFYFTGREDELVRTLERVVGQWTEGEGSTPVA